MLIFYAFYSTYHYIYLEYICFFLFSPILFSFIFLPSFPFSLPYFTFSAHSTISLHIFSSLFSSLYFLPSFPSSFLSPAPILFLFHPFSFLYLFFFHMFLLTSLTLFFSILSLLSPDLIPHHPVSCPSSIPLIPSSILLALVSILPSLFTPFYLVSFYIPSHPFPPSFPSFFMFPSSILPLLSCFYPPYYLPFSFLSCRSKSWRISLGSLWLPSISLPWTPQ